MNPDQDLSEAAHWADLPGLPEPPGSASDLRLSPRAAEVIREEIEKAGGREVCFLARVDEARELIDPRAVARGNKAAVLVAARVAEEGEVVIHNHPSGVLEPSEADLDVAARLYEEGLGSAITDNAAAGLYVVVEPPAPRHVEPLDIEALEGLIGPGGPLVEAHPRYEDRPGQRAMLRLVAGLFNEGGVGIVEAGTGTGKSLAYLMPAAAWALQNGERTVISTNTINLQEQLDGKDLPLVRSLLGDDVDWALVKGRGNYVSIRRARLAAETAPLLFEDDRADELDSLLEWINGTEDGSLGDLAFVPSDDVWDEVRERSGYLSSDTVPAFSGLFLPEITAQGRGRATHHRESPPPVHGSVGPHGHAKLLGVGGSPRLSPPDPRRSAQHRRRGDLAHGIRGDPPGDVSASGPSGPEGAGRSGRRAGGARGVRTARRPRPS